MKAKITQLAALTVIGLFLQCNTSAQFDTMNQGDHKIIIEGAQKIQELFKEIAEANEKGYQTSEELQKEYETEMEAYQELPEDDDRQRLDRQVKRIHVRHSKIMVIKSLSEENLERLERADLQLTKMVEAAKNIEIEFSASQKKLEKSIQKFREKEEVRSPIDEKFYEVIASVIKSTDNEKCQLVGKLERLRETVKSRREELVDISEKCDSDLTDLWLQNPLCWPPISLDATEESLNGIATFDDPLGMKCITPSDPGELLHKIKDPVVRKPGDFKKCQRNK